MASARTAWGIDIGNRALKAVKLVRDGDQFRVDDFEIIEHDTVLSNSGDNRDSLIQSAVAQFVQRHPLKGTPVAVGVSGQQSFARFIKLPPVEEKKIPEIVKFEAIQQIPFPLDDVEWSYQLFRSPDSPDVEVGIFAMRKELLASHIKFFTDVDMNVQVVQLSPLAVYNAMFNDGRLRGTTMLIDLGAENTDLVIADENSIWMRSIPIGGNNFTETLTKAFKLNFQKAEELKRNAATSKYARQIFQAMRPVFADLVAEIQRSVGFYSSVHRDSRIKKCIAIGGTFKLPGLQKYLQQNLTLDIERLDTMNVAPGQDSKLAPNFSENVLSLVTATGLAIQGLGDAKVDSSLLPQKIRREKMWKEKTKWFGAAAALVCLGTGVAAASWFVQKFQFELPENRDRQTKINQIRDDGKRLNDAWQAIQDSGGPERQRIVNIRSLEAHRALWGSLLADVAKALPAAPTTADELKKTPRKERKVISIDSLQTIYEPNLTPILAADLSNVASRFGLNITVAAPTGVDPGAIPPPEAPPADAAADPNAPHGFLVLARLTTPNQAGPGLIDETFIRNLLKIGPNAQNPKVAYAIPKVQMLQYQQLKQNQSRLSKMQSDYTQATSAQGLQPANTGFSGAGSPFGGGGERPFGGSQFGGGGPTFGGGAPTFGGGAQPGGQDDSAAYIDRITGEDVRDDWEITVLFVVQMDPTAPAPTASADGSTPPAGG